MKSLLFSILYILLLSCAQNPESKHINRFAEKTTKGITISPLSCKGDLQQTYALYLPTSYNPDNKYALLICFDPHGDGSYPVNLIKDKAEKINLIVAGSNFIRNGLQQSEISSALDLLMNELTSNLNIDNSKIYTLGFSGGARVALSTLFSNYNIKGVIACSGSIPAAYIPGNKYIVGIGGTIDMNFNEMVEMENGFPPENKKHILLTFPGKHSWPPANTLNVALDWLRIGEMKDSLVPLDNETINHFIKSVYNDSLTLTEKYRSSKQIINTLSGLTDIAHYQNIVGQLEKNTQFQEELRAEEQTYAYEKVKQQQYQEAFANKTASWWKNEVIWLNQSINQSKKRAEKSLYQRMLSYISLYAFSACNQSKRTKDIKALDNFVEIYGLADPQNPDYFYFLACSYAFKGDKNGVTHALKQARQNGFYDKQKIMGDALFNELLTSKELKEILE